MLASAAIAVVLAAAQRPPDVAAPALVQRAVAAAAAPGLRAEVLDWRPAVETRCEPERAEAIRLVTASGQVPLRVEGRDPRGARCEGWGWARVRAVAPALRASRAIRAGEPLAGAVALGEAEVVAGRRAVAELPGDAVAARPIAAGAPLEAAAIRTGPPPGAPVTVVVRAGALAVAQPGRAVACGRERACAVLPSGRRVEGRVQDGALWVEAP